MDTNHGFILATTLSPASVNDTNYLDYCTVFSKHTKNTHQKRLCRKTPTVTSWPEKTLRTVLCERIQPQQSSRILKSNETKKISKVRYIVEQYFGISHLKDNAQRGQVPADR